MTINDTLFVNGQFSVEGKQYKTVGVKHEPWASTVEFLTAMPAQLRHEGMIAFVQGVSEIEFWQFDGGIADADLIHKFSTTASKVTFVETTLPPVGVADMLYVIKSTGNISIWDGAAYQVISGDGFGVTLQVNGVNNDTQGILNFIDSTDITFTYISGGDIKATIVSGKLIPLGGKTAQPLVKASSTDNDVEWGTVPLPYAAATEVTANNYRVLFPVSEVSYVEGRAVIVKFPTTNTGAITLEYESLGARSVVNTDGVALTAGDIVAGAYYELIATSTKLQIARSDIEMYNLHIKIIAAAVPFQTVLAGAASFEAATGAKVGYWKRVGGDYFIGVSGFNAVPDNFMSGLIELIEFEDLGCCITHIGVSAFEGANDISGANKYHLPNVTFIDEKGFKSARGEAGVFLPKWSSEVETLECINFDVVGYLVGLPADITTLTPFKVSQPAFINGTHTILIPANSPTANLIIQCNTATPTGVLASRAAFETALAITGVQQPEVVLFEHDAIDATKLSIGVNGLKKLPDTIFQNNTEIIGFYDLGTGLEEIGFTSFSGSLLSHISSETVTVMDMNSLAGCNIDLLWLPKFKASGWGAYPFITNITLSALTMTLDDSFSTAHINAYTSASKDAMLLSKPQIITGHKIFNSLYTTFDNLGTNPVVMYIRTDRNVHCYMQHTNIVSTGSAGINYINNLDLTTQTMNGGSAHATLPNTYAINKLTGDILLSSSQGQIFFSRSLTDYRLASKYGMKVGLSGCMILRTLTKVQRDVLTNLEAGAVIFQTDNTPGLYVYNGTAWVNFVETLAGFAQYCVPYADASGKLITDADFKYDGTTLTVGDNGFGGNTGINFNGGRGRIDATGTGLNISVSGGSPADSSKALEFYNVTRRWLKLLLPPGDAALTPLEGMANMHWYPETNEALTLGKSAQRWNELHVKDIIATGKLHVGGVVEYADNAAAVAAGLAAGDVYRTGDNLKIVH